MAIWQFKVLLVSRLWLESGGDVGALGAEAGCDAGAAWSFEEPAELEARLTQVLPRRASWQARHRAWGDEQGDDVQLWTERGRIGAIAVQFDLRSPNMRLVKAVADLAEELGFVVFVPHLRRVIGPGVEALLKVAGESDAAHFALDPGSFLSQLDPVNAKAT